MKSEPFTLLEGLYSNKHIFGERELTTSELSKRLNKLHNWKDKYNGMFVAIRDGRVIAAKEELHLLDKYCEERGLKYQTCILF
ncbi:MAG: hypothetical protein KJ623_01955 [Nanoarchaeota archaeon]|nr:hypothetical protein [Nanoarchaeota archaeon]MBU0963378.1 hypothetical protein [Nanoarchaeota archaeon]